MKKIDLNSVLTGPGGETLTLADLQRKLIPGALVSPEQTATPATGAALAIATLDARRGSSYTDAQTLAAYSVIKKLTAGQKSKKAVELTDEEFNELNDTFSSMAPSIRAPFIEMVAELNPVEDNKGAE